MEPLPTAGRAEGVTKPQPLIQGNYFEDSDLNEESPRGSHTYPLIPFYTLLLAPNPKLRAKVVARAKDHRLGHPHFVTLNKSPAFRTCLHWID